jgi:hypothetical protein
MTSEKGNRSKESEIEELGSTARQRVARACDLMSSMTPALAAVVAQYRLHNDGIERKQGGGR